MTAPVLMRIRGLRTWFYSGERHAFVRAVDGVDLDLLSGRTLGIAGESGSGKSVTLLSALGLVAGAPGVVAGEVWFGEDKPVNLLAGLDRCVTVSEDEEGAIRVDADRHRWQHTLQENLAPYRRPGGISIVFQNPRAALNPGMTIGAQIGEVIAMRHPRATAAEVRERALNWLEKVRIDAPSRRHNQYPHNLSGGMCQRAMIAMALAAEPALLVADEPTTGLDATIQARIVDLLEDVARESGTTMVVISHDIGVIRRLADDVAVMYAGRVLETGPAADVLDGRDEERHPYTSALLASVPGRAQRDANGHLPVIGGDVPDPLRRVDGCRFRERCASPAAAIDERCRSSEPGLDRVNPDHRVRCWPVQGEAG